ncbi:MAG: amidohydrolase family protein [Planctomycetes bacterium]|nr:amidohydrolase family protein [Planctomycetota bacterium]
MTTLQTYSARWIFPVDQPPIEHGTITILGDRISAVAQRGTRTPDVDLGNVAILPGFVNTHTHLDLSGARGLVAPVAHASGSSVPDFTQWLRCVIAFRRSRTPEQVQTDIAAAIAECLRFGTTLIGDIASGGVSWELLTNAGCRSVVFHETLGLSEDRARLAMDQARTWLAHRSFSDRCIAGVSPHAPYTVRSTQYSVLGTQHSSLRIATHLAETLDEVELLRDRRGPFVDFLREMNVYDPGGLVSDPLEVVRTLPSGIFVHCNYLDPATPFLPTQTVVVCPRTHAAFGHSRHPFPKLNVRVALGTDSLASNPDLDILAEVRFLRQYYPEVEPAALLRMLTLNGAESLGFGGVTGSLTPGKSADLAVLPLPAGDMSDPHDSVLLSGLAVGRVMFRGVWRDKPERVG